MSVDFELFSDNNSRVTARLKERYKRVITANIDAIEGKRVLDMAANNGRWTYAALASGARHVTSVEGREARVADAKRFLEANGMSGKYDANTGDMFDFLYRQDNPKFDTIMCLGVYYHVMDHYHLLKLMDRTNAQTIIIDSGFVRSMRNAVHVQMEDPRLHKNALAMFEGQTAEPVALVTLGLMIQMAWNLGFSCRPVVWDPKDVSNRHSVKDYMAGRRFTLRLERTGETFDPDWKQHWAEALSALNPKLRKLLNKDTHDLVSEPRAWRPERIDAQPPASGKTSLKPASVGGDPKPDTVSSTAATPKSVQEMAEFSIL